MEAFAERLHHHHVPVLEEAVEAVAYVVEAKLSGARVDGGESKSGAAYFPVAG